MKQLRNLAMGFVLIAIVLAGLPLASTAATHPDDSGWLDPQAPPAPDGIIVRAQEGVALESLGLEAHGEVKYHSDLPEEIRFAVVRPVAGKSANMMAISSLAGVASAKENGHYGLAGRMPLDPFFREERMWGWAAIEAANAYPAGLVTNVTMGLIDTGCPSSHEDWGYIPWGDKFYIRDGNVYKQVGQDEEWEGHGSHVGGIMWALPDNGRGAAGLLSESGRKVCIKAFHGGWATYEDVALSFFVARTEGVRVVNGSFGGAESDLVTDAIAFYLSAGDTWAVFACGNQGSAHWTCTHPASLASASEEFERVLSVGALEAPGVAAPYSNNGAVLWAPGSSIWSTTPWGYEDWSGTSMASPHVAAIMAAILYDHPQYSGDDMYLHFVNCSPYVAGAGFAPMADCAGSDDSVWREVFLPIVNNNRAIPTSTIEGPPASSTPPTPSPATATPVGPPPTWTLAP